MSTLLWEIAILYFWETRTILKKLFWGAVDGVANTTDVYGNVRRQEQSRYGFYWQVCENIWDWKFLGSSYD